MLCKNVQAIYKYFSDRQDSDLVVDFPKLENGAEDAAVEDGEPGSGSVGDISASDEGDNVSDFDHDDVSDHNVLVSLPPQAQVESDPDPDQTSLHYLE